MLGIFGFSREQDFEGCQWERSATSAGNYCINNDVIFLFVLPRAQLILANNQLDRPFHVFIYLLIYLFISSLCMFRASSAHHQEIELY